MLVYWAKLEAELPGIREVADATAGYVHDRNVNREERLLDIPNRVRDAVELGIHHGATVALTVAQVHSGHALHHLVRLLEGQELADHDGSREDFDEAVDAVVDLVPAEGIVEEATGTWDPKRWPTSRLSPTGQRSSPSFKDVDAEAALIPAQERPFAFCIHILY
jgi:hypothetical protein